MRCSDDMVRSRWLLVTLILAACGARSGSGAGSNDHGLAADGPLACPAPKVFCSDPAPSCPSGTFPEAQTCFGGYCPDRCWTGACETCAGDCQKDSDCVIAHRHGCCDLSLKSCRVVIPRSALESDPCYFLTSKTSTGFPQPPAGCAEQCTADPLCWPCWHCPPPTTRCEGGTCVGAWPDCEPDCGCI